MDKNLKELLKLEQERQNNGLELIASENFASKSVRKLCGSILTNKYAEGYPGRRYYGGCKYVDQVEQLAIDTICKIFHCNYANVQPHSGSSANMVAYRALLNKGDKILSLSLEAGGHLSHGSPVNFSSQDYTILHYNLAKDGRIDYEGLEEIARTEKPRLVLAGFSAYPFQVNFERIGKVAKEVGAYFMVDMAHIAGLIAAGYHPSPFPYADIVTSTTHKTLRGPRGGIILTNSEEIIKKVNFALFPGLQGGPLENIIGAKAQCFLEATTPEYKEYIKNVLINTKACADEFKKLGDEASDTETHLFLLNTKKSFGLTGKESEVKLEEINITVNKNMLPNDDERPNVTSGIRMGFAALTTRGIKEEGAREIARIIHGFLGGTLSTEDAKTRVRNITDNLLRIEDIDQVTF